MIALIAVFRMELNISSLIACSALWMISTEIGSRFAPVTAGPVGGWAMWTAALLRRLRASPESEAFRGMWGGGLGGREPETVVENHAGVDPATGTAATLQPARPGSPGAAGEHHH